MSRTFTSPRHKALVAFIKAKRKAAGLSQQAVADRLDRYQSFITSIERGQKRIDVVELMELAEAIGFDPQEAIRKLKKLSTR